MEEKAQEKTQVSLSTLAATNGYMQNVFVTARLFLYNFDADTWLRVDIIKPSKTPGKIIVVFDNLQEQEIDASYMFGLRLV